MRAASRQPGLTNRRLLLPFVDRKLSYLAALMFGPRRYVRPLNAARVVYRSSLALDVFGR